MPGAYFRAGAYKRDAIVVIQLGAYIHRVLTFYGCLLFRFYGTACSNLSVTESDAKDSTSLLNSEFVIVDDVEFFPKLPELWRRRVCQVCDYSFTLM